MARPIRYLTAGEVEMLNQDILARAGQVSSLLRERGLLESAVVRPQTAAYYAGADLITQAALYMVGIALNHPFVDGNKRTGYIAGLLFLRLNGFTRSQVALNDPEVGRELERVVARERTFADFVKMLSMRFS